MASHGDPEIDPLADDFEVRLVVLDLVETVADPEFQSSMRRIVPAKRLGRGDEAAAVVTWLASSDASYVFGQVIATDGGWTL